MRNDGLQRDIDGENQREMPESVDICCCAHSPCSTTPTPYIEYYTFMNQLAGTMSFVH